MKRTWYAALLMFAACGSDKSTPAPTETLPAEDQVGVPSEVAPQLQLAYENAPWYAKGCPAAETDTVLVTGFYESASVSYALKPPDDATHASYNFSRCPQGLFIGNTASGAAFLVVVTTDYSANTARVVSFIDNDADGLPDAATEATIKSHSSAHLHSSVYDPASGAMYVIDGLNDRILRYEDTSGDKIPDGNTETVFLDGAGSLVAGISAIRLRAPAENSVEVVQRRTVGALRRADGYIKVTDTNDDGVADQVATVAATAGFKVVFHGFVREGDTSVEVEGDNSTNYELRVGTDVLATFTGTGILQVVGLSRALAANEIARVYEGTGTVTLAEMVAHPLSSTVISHIDHVLDPKGPGDTVKFIGVGITGSESVKARLKNGNEDFVACTLTDSTTESLTVEIPDFELSGVATVVFEITPVSGNTYRFALMIRGESE